MSSNRTPDKAGAGTRKQSLKDTEGVSRMKATDNKSADTTKKATEGSRRDGTKKEADKKPGKTTEKTSAGSRINGVSDKAMSTAGSAVICKRNNGALDVIEESVSAVIKAAAGAESKALDKEPVNKGRKARACKEKKAVAEASSGRGNKALDKEKKAVAEASSGRENKVLDKADVEPSKGRKARTDGGNEALDKVNVEPVNMAKEVERGYMAPTKLTKHLKHAVETLKLRLSEISAAAEQVNKLVNDIIPVLCTDPAFKGTEILKTGSYYEKVKISKPNEFDIMLKIPCEGLRIAESNVSGGYYTLKINRRPSHPLTKYVENGNISGQKLLNRLRELIRSDLNRLGMDITVERKHPTSPAVTILIGNHKISVDLVLALEVKGSWPRSTSEGMKIETWLGAKVKREYKFEPLIFVAKQLKNTEEVLWRISFSHIEKAILMNHGNAKTCCETEGNKCCRKQCLKLMKYLLEQLKNKGSRNMTHFCSYHAKTALLHSCTLYPKDDDWRPEDLAGCFGRYIEYFLKCLDTANLPNFFIPSLNLFSEEFIPKNCLTYLQNKLKEQKSQDYPLFNQ